jgi:hypothetical protein
VLSDVFGIVLILLVLACPLLVLLGLAATWGRRRLTPGLALLGVVAIVLAVAGLWLAIDPLVVDGITCFDMPVFDVHTGDTAQCLVQNRWHAGVGVALAIVPTAAWLVVTVRQARHGRSSASEAPRGGAGPSELPGS